MFIVEALYEEWESEGEFRTIGRATNFGRRELISVDWRIVDSRNGEIIQTFDAAESRFYIDIDPVKHAHRQRLTESISHRLVEMQRQVADLNAVVVDGIFATNNLEDFLRIDEPKLDYDWMTEGF